MAVKVTTHTNGEDKTVYFQSSQIGSGVIYFTEINGQLRIDLSQLEGVRVVLNYAEKLPLEMSGKPELGNLDVQRLSLA